MPSNNSTQLSTVNSVALDDMAHDVELLRIVEDQIGRLTSLKNTLRGALKARLGESQLGTINGVPVIRWSSEYRVSVVIGVLRQRYPEVARECEDISQVRKFEVLAAA